jgi:NitT/TauT family transport system substrate-binding protein
MFRCMNWIAGSILLSLIIGSSAAAEPLRLGLSTWVGYGPLYIAKEKAFFKDEAVEVQLIKLGDLEGEPLGVEALAADQVDAVMTTVDTALKHWSEEQRFRYLFAVDDSKGGDGIVADLEIQDVIGLKGRRIALEEGSVSEFYLGVLLMEVGIAPEDVDVIDMDGEESVNAFAAKEVDAVVTWEPWLTSAAQAGHGHRLVDSSSSPGLIVDVAITTPAKLEEHLDGLKGLYRAWLRGVEFQRTNEKEADEIMARGVGGWLNDPAVFAETRAGIAYYDDAMNKAFIGTPEAPGRLVETVANALELGKQTGQFEHDIQPAELIAFEIVNQ